MPLSELYCFPHVCVPLPQADPHPRGLWSHSAPLVLDKAHPGPSNRRQCLAGALGAHSKPESGPRCSPQPTLPAGCPAYTCARRHSSKFPPATLTPAVFSKPPPTLGEENERARYGPHPKGLLSSTPRGPPHKLHAATGLKTQIPSKHLQDHQ